MTYSDYQITIEEYSDFVSSKKLSEQLKSIWEDILKRIKEDKLRKEAKKSGFTFESDPDKEDDVVADYKIISPANGSDKLQDYFDQNIYRSIVCLKI
jgi:hypothetical protein